MSSLRCTYCQEDICSVGLNCVECDDFNLCLQCASCGVEVGGHKKSHDYKVVTSTVWTAAEEMLLLDAIEQYGYGNWDDTSAYVGTKTSHEVKEHYHSLYINGNIGKVTLPKEHATDIADHTVVSGGPLSPSLATHDGGLEITSEDYHLLGYMPLRDDFEREYDNEAETLVSGLMETQEDDELDAAVKLTQVDMYSRRLRERARRKRIIHDYGLVQEFFNLNNGKQKSPAKRKITKEEKDFQDKMRAFAQFQSAIEQEQFFTELQHEKQLKSRVKELMRFRKNGLTKLSEIEDYERAKLLREKRKETQKKAPTSPTTRTIFTAKKSLTTSSTTSTTTTVKSDGKNERKSSFSLGGLDDGSSGRPVDISQLPGYELLTERECKLCTAINLKPAHYTAIKTVLLKDHVKTKQGISTKTPYMKGLSKASKNLIMKLLTESGWLSAC